MEIWWSCTDPNEEVIYNLFSHNCQIYAIMVDKSRKQEEPKVKSVDCETQDCGNFHCESDMDRFVFCCPECMSRLNELKKMPEYLIRPKFKNVAKT